MSRDGTRLLAGVESARQRLADALGIWLGTYPAARDFGVTPELDRDVTPATEASIAAEIANLFQRPVNGLSDMTLNAVEFKATADRVQVTVAAIWRGERITGGLGGG